jgi:XisI protein
LFFVIGYLLFGLKQISTIDIGQELVEMGIAKEDIVLGLHPHYKRPLTGYGVA